MTAFSTALLEQSNGTNGNPLLYSFAHVVQREGRNGGGRDRFHFHTRLGFRSRNGLDTGARIEDFD